MLEDEVDLVDVEEVVGVELVLVLVLVLVLLLEGFRKGKIESKRLPWVEEEDEVVVGKRLRVGVGVAVVVAAGRLIPFWLPLPLLLALPLEEPRVAVAVASPVSVKLEPSFALPKLGPKAGATGPILLAPSA